MLGAKSTAVQALRGADLCGKVGIVTGGNSGIGLETVGVLAQAGCKVYATARNVEAGKQQAEIVSQKYDTSKGEILVRQLDLTSLPSIHQFCDDFIKQGDPLHYLILNAGIMSSPKMYTDHGFEYQIGTNHFGHFALTKDLLPKLTAQDFESRVVVVSSSLHKYGQIILDDLHYKNGRQYIPRDAYSQSKLANILFAKQLAYKLKDTNVNVYSLRPGVVNTNLSRYFGVLGWIYRQLPMSSIFSFIKTVEQGASTSIYAAVAPELSDKSGAYLGDCTIQQPSEGALDMQMAENLWKVTSEQLEAAETDIASS